VSFKRWAFLFSIAALATLLLRAFVFEGIYIATASMEPTFPIGAHLFLDKLTLLFREPSRGEIIVFRSPVPPYLDMVKRVIAVPGDIVELKEKKVILNGNPQDEPYAQHTRQEERLKGDDIGPLTVPAGSFFVLGDNRDESDDSSVWRDQGTGEAVYFVPQSQVRGVLRGFYRED